MKNRNFVVIVIEAAAIYQFIIIDIAAGSGFYTVLKQASSSIIFATAGTVAGVELIKRLPKWIRAKEKQNRRLI